MNATDYLGMPHPYYPLGVEVAGYIKNEHSVPYLLGTFAAGSAVIFAVTGFLARLQNPSLPRSEMITAMWFVLCTSLFPSASSQLAAQPLNHRFKNANFYLSRFDTPLFRRYAYNRLLCSQSKLFERCTKQ